MLVYILVPELVKTNYYYSLYINRIVLELTGTTYGVCVCHLVSDYDTNEL